LLSSQVLTGDVRRQRDHALAVEAIVFTHDRGVPDRRHVPEQRMRAAIAAHRDHPQIVERGHARLWNLDLYLKRDAGPRVGPVVRRDEPAGRRRGGEGSPDLIDGDAELARHLTVHIDLDRRIVERLAVLQITKRGDVRELLPNLHGKRPAGREIRPRHSDLDRGGGPEVHDPIDDVSRLERKLGAGETLVEPLPEGFLEFRQSNAGVRLQRHLQHTFVRTAGPEEDRVDRVRRRLDTDVAERDRHVVWTGRLLDFVEHLGREELG